MKKFHKKAWPGHSISHNRNTKPLSVIVSQISKSQLFEDNGWKTQEPNTIQDYNELLQMCSNFKNEKKAVSMCVFHLNEMHLKHLTPDQFTYAILIGMAGKFQQPDEAILLFEQMETHLPPTLIVYNALIHSLGHCKRWKTVLLTFNKMKARGIRPNLATYCSLITIFVRLNRLSQALTFYEEMKTQDLKLNQVAFNTVINLFSKLEKPLDAANILNQMKLSDIKPDILSYKPLLEMYSKLNMPLEAYQTFQGIISPNIV